MDKQCDRVLIKQGAEAKLYTGVFLGRPCIIKERFPKTYRHELLDRSLTSQRIKSEVRSIMRCRASGIRVPAIYYVDLEASTIYMEHIENNMTVRDYIIVYQKSALSDAHSRLNNLMIKIGQVLGTMHQKNIIHGDLTTSNMLLAGKDEQLVLIDFGLGYIESLSEDKGVDLYVLERAFLSTHPNSEELFEVLLEAYKNVNPLASVDVFRKLDDVRMRGRKRTMVG